MKGKNDDAPEWLRRSYTRTIREHLRTVAQLRLSFEDIRERWGVLCRSHEKLFDVTPPMEETSPLALLPGTRKVVDNLVSQLKCIKQELLAHLSTLGESLQTTPSPSPADGGSSSLLLPDWVKDVAGRGSRGSSSRSSTQQCETDTLQCYLQALWLARRVWVWSLCFASITMDLELLSGSVSVAAELFFGDPLVAHRAHRNQHDEGHTGCVFHSAFDLQGGITEKQLYECIAQKSCRSGDLCSGQPLLKGERSASLPSAVYASLDKEECELHVFFGCAAPDPSPTVAKGAPFTSLHVDPVSTTSDSQIAASDTSLAAVRDLFWVQAAAFCYSIIVRDDASTAKLQMRFEKVADELCFESCASGVVPNGIAATKCSTHRDPRQQPHTALLYHITSFLLLLAELLADEDYVAVRELLQREGLTVEVSLPSTGATNSCSVASTSVFFSEGSLLLFLIRLLAEHVMRRRWTEQGLGNAFRPVEPPIADLQAGSAVATSELRRRALRRLATALTSEKAFEKVSEAHPSDHSRREKPQMRARLCHEIQLLMLHDMGLDWPLPASLLQRSLAFR